MNAAGSMQEFLNAWELRYAKQWVAIGVAASSPIPYAQLLSVGHADWSAVGRHLPARADLPSRHVPLVLRAACRLHPGNAGCLGHHQYDDDDFEQWNGPPRRSKRILLAVFADPDHRVDSGRSEHLLWNLLVAAVLARASSFGPRAASFGAMTPNRPLGGTRKLGPPYL